MRRTLCLLLLLCLLTACAAKNTDTALEHGPDAGAHGYRETTVFCLNADGLLNESQRKLPWQSDMESYALSFVLADSGAQYTVKRDGDRAIVDITNFPIFPSQALEAAAIAGIVNTMLAFPDTDAIALTFEGVSVDTLACGTHANSIYTEPIVVDEAR